MLPTNLNEITKSGVGPVKTGSSAGLYLNPGGYDPAAMTAGTVAVDPNVLNRNTYGGEATGGVDTGGNAAAYSAYVNSLNQQRALLDQQRAQNEGLIGQNYDVQRGALNTGLRQGQENLNRQQMTAERNKAMSLRDLGANVRNAYKGGINKLGVQGAADSSAAKMYGVALGAEEGKGRAAVTDDFQYNVQGIDLARKQAQETFNDQMAALDVWKQGELTKIVQQYQTQAQYLDSQLAQASPAQAAAITQAKQQAATQAVQGIQGVQTTYGAATEQANKLAATQAADQRGYREGPDYQGALNAFGGMVNNGLQGAYNMMFKKREQ